MDLFDKGLVDPNYSRELMFDLDYRKKSVDSLFNRIRNTIEMIMKDGSSSTLQRYWDDAIFSGMGEYIESRDRGLDISRRFQSTFFTSGLEEVMRRNLTLFLPAIKKNPHSDLYTTSTSLTYLLASRRPEQAYGAMINPLFRLQGSDLLPDPKALVLALSVYVIRNAERHGYVEFDVPVLSRETKIRTCF